MAKDEKADEETLSHEGYARKHLYVSAKQRFRKRASKAYNIAKVERKGKLVVSSQMGEEEGARDLHHTVLLVSTKSRR